METLNVKPKHIMDCNPQFCTTCAIGLSLQEKGYSEFEVQFQYISYSDKNGTYHTLNTSRDLLVWQRALYNSNQCQPITIELDETERKARIIQKGEQKWKVKEKTKGN